MWIGTASTRALWCVAPRPTCYDFMSWPFHSMKNFNCHLYDENVFREYTRMNDCVLHFRRLVFIDFPFDETGIKLNFICASLVFHSFDWDSVEFHLCSISIPCRSANISQSNFAMKFVLAICKHCQRPSCDFYYVTPGMIYCQMIFVNSDSNAVH